MTLRFLCFPRTWPVRISVVNYFAFLSGAKACVVLLGLALAGRAAETLPEITARLSSETTEAYRASPFSEFSRDYFARLTRDKAARPKKDEIEIDAGWRFEIPAAPSLVTTTMRGHFEEFMARRMEVKLAPAVSASGRSGRPAARRIVLLETGAGDPQVPESYTLEITRKQVVIQGRDPQGVRDGIVRLTDMMGLRQGPMLPVGKWVVKPRVPVRLGAVPCEGSFREAVFLGYNAVFV